MPPTVYQDGQSIKSDMYEYYGWWLCPKYDDNYMTMQWQYDKSKVCHDEDDGSCMAIYLGMAMEMP